jgi:N-acetylglucosaminyl-diphospho-decaprenol L-rhamnosyltransferase
MSQEPRVDVVVVSYETRETLLEGLAALVTEPTASVVVVDNASRDGTAAAVRERFPSGRLGANAENVGFARACNQGARESRAPYLLFLNPDATLAPGSLGALEALMEARPRVGVVGPRTRSANGDIQVSTGPDLSLVSEIRQRRLVRGVARREAAILVEAEGLHAVEREVDWVSGACLMIRREAFDAVSGFDDRFFLYEEDADLCRRVRAAGWTVLFSPGAEARHALGRSMARAPERARLEYQRSHLLYYRKHCGPAQRVALRLWLLARAELALVLGALSLNGRRTRDALALLRAAVDG